VNQRKVAALLDKIMLIANLCLGFSIIGTQNSGDHYTAILYFASHILFFSFEDKIDEKLA